MRNSQAMPWLGEVADPLDIVTITASSYTLSMADMGRTIVFNSASAQAVTVALLSPTFSVTLIRVGAGAVTLAAGTGVTLNGNTVLPLYEPIQISSYSNGVFQSGTSQTIAVSTISQTIATAAGNTDLPVIAPITGNVSAVYFSGTDALAASDTNYITWTVTNRGQAGVSSTAVLGSTTTNSTRATGGTALSAETLRTLTLTSTAADLAVVIGDRLRVRYAVTGTLANTVTGAVTMVIFTR